MEKDKTAETHEDKDLILIKKLTYLIEKEPEHMKDNNES